MFKKLGLALILLALTSCATRKAKSGFEDIADFGLSDDGAGVKVDDKAYFDDLKRSESSVSFESSLPLPLRIGKSSDPFDNVPSLAKPSLDSRLNVSIGPCTFNLLSGPVQVDRYLLAGQWIKLTEGLPAKTPVKLEPNQDLNIKAITKVGIEISESMTPVCRKMFEGKSKVPVGRFHLNKSRIGLVPGPGSPAISFGARSLDPQGKMIYLHWQGGTNMPSLIDDFDFPATSESGIFRAQMAAKGFYYLAFQAVLRMDQVDSMIVKLPYHGPAVVAPSKGPVPSSAAGAPAAAGTTPNTSLRANPTGGKASQSTVSVPASGKVVAPSTLPSKPGLGKVPAATASKPGSIPSKATAAGGAKAPVSSHAAKALSTPGSAKGGTVPASQSKKPQNPAKKK